MPLWEEYKSQAKARGALAMELFVVHSSPAADMELVKATLPAHLDYQKKMEAEGTLVMAGPVSDESGERMDAEGMIIYRAADLAAASAIAEADPMHAAGARTFKVRKWLVNEGSLGFTVSLSSQTVTLP